MPKILKILSKKPTLIGLAEAAKNKQNRDIPTLIKPIIAPMPTIEQLTRPVNFEDAMSTFIEAAEQGNFKTPHFIYDTNLAEQALNLAQIIDEAKIMLRRILSDDKAENFLLSYFRSILRDYSLIPCIADGIIHLNDLTTSQTIAEICGRVNNSSIAKAYQIAKDKKLFYPVEQDVEFATLGNRLREKHFDAASVKRAIKLFAHDLGALPADYDVTISDEISLPAFGSTPKPTFIIPKNTSIDGIELILILAVVGTLLRSNTSAQQLGLIVPVDDLITGGIGTYNANIERCKYSGFQSPTGVLEIIALREAEEGGSFVDVFRKILGMLPNEIEDESIRMKETWRITSMVFAGCTNLENPHNFANQTARYPFDGEQFVANLSKNGLYDLTCLSFLGEKFFKKYMKEFSKNETFGLLPYQGINKAFAESLLTL
jgi:hypothetical protein